MTDKVYILHRDDSMPNEPTYGDVVIGVYDSEEKAIAATPKNSDSTFYICEYEVL